MGQHLTPVTIRAYYLILLYSLATLSVVGTLFCFMRNRETLSPLGKLSLLGFVALTVLTLLPTLLYSLTNLQLQAWMRLTPVLTMGTCALGLCTAVTMLFSSRIPTAHRIMTAVLSILLVLVIFMGPGIFLLAGA